MSDRARALERWPVLAERADALRRSLRGLGAGADDATQEALVRAAVAPGAVPSEQRLGGWLRTIGRRVAIDEWRRGRRAVAIDVAAHAAAPERDVTTVDVEQALARLSTADRRLLHAVASGYRYAEIARAGGASEAAIRQRVARARARLLRELGGER